MNEHQHNKKLQISPSSIDLQSLKALSVLGRGAKGVVFLVQNEEEEEEGISSLFNSTSSKQTLALKVISKASIEKKRKTNEEQGKVDGDLYRRIWFERDVLNLFDHPLLPKLKGLVITDEIVGFAIDYCSGGDLNTTRKQQSEKMFSDDIIRFYAAELVLALEYLHHLGVIYRDLKPENVMIQENGHLMLVDFDLSTKISSRSEKSQSQSSSPYRSSDTSSISSPTKNTKKKKSLPAFFTCNSGISLDDDSVSPSESRVDSVSTEKSNSFVGTEEYVAPEIIEGNGHDFSVDWWGLGVVLYEMLYGKTPFRGINRKETFYRILTKSPELVGEPTALRDLIGKLLEKDPNQRISIEGIKGHEFFQGLDWDSVTKISRPPFIPSGGSLNEEDEDREGIKGIDVKSFVQMVFNDVDMKKEDETGTGTENMKGYQNNQNKEEGVWVEGLSNSTKNDDFLIF